VLVDVAGRVDPGIGPVIASVISHLDETLVDPVAVAEDRAYTATQDPYRRWQHLTMPTLLLRATQELHAGSGHVVPADDRERFLREVPRSTLIEIDANHLTINTHPEAANAIGSFLADVHNR
jgi:pimeloyl-ACP methyl ester carboxylesterase